MPDIQTLTSAVQSLETSASRWSRGALWLVAATAIVASLYFIVSWVASRKATALQEAQAALIHAKDSQLSRDLKDKDVSISAADQKAADAKQETARLTKEAEQAKTERAEADKQIAIAKADALRAREGIANAEAVSANAGVEVARLQVVVANAEKRRLEAEKALLELQESIKARRLSAEQQSQLIRLLRVGPRGEIKVVCEVSNREAYGFANDFVNVLTKAGWTVEFVPRVLFVGTPPTEIVVKAGNPNSVRAIALLYALKTVGIIAEGEWHKDMPDDEVTLAIPNKP